MRGQRTARGFTLIEVLVALAIVAVGMAAVLGALNSSANTVAFMRDKTFAQWVALNQLATLRISGQTPSVGKSDGDLDYAGRSWHWHQEVVASEVPGVMRIDVSVRPKDAKGGEDSGWYTTLSGIYGDAVAPARGDFPQWGSQILMAGSANPLGTPGAFGTAPITPSPGSMAPGAMGSGSTLGSGGSLGSGSTLGSGDTLGSGSTPAPYTPPPSPEAPPDSGLEGSGNQ